MIDNVTKPWRRVLFEQDEYTQRNHINIYGFRALVNGVWGAMERMKFIHAFHSRRFYFLPAGLRVCFS